MDKNYMPEVAKMLKSDLRTGDIVEVNECLCFVSFNENRWGNTEDNLHFINGEIGYLPLNSYNQDLTHKENSDYNIKKVWRFDYLGNSFNISLRDDLEKIQPYFEITKQPKLTPAEKTILENLPKDYEWIARDKDNQLAMYEESPIRSTDWNIWFPSSKDCYHIRLFNHLFQFIKWEDQEPYNIKELLGE